jgi:hypothetical protein
MQVHQGRDIEMREAVETGDRVGRYSSNLEGQNSSSPEQLVEGFVRLNVKMRYN